MLKHLGIRFSFLTVVFLCSLLFALNCTKSSNQKNAGRPQKMLRMVATGTSGGDPAVAICGDGIVTPPEECDDSAGNSCASPCNNKCQNQTPEQTCGNGVLNSGEGCDDGNVTDGDACSATCALEVTGPLCGNGVLETPEVCDDSNTTSEDGCTNACLDETGTLPGPPSDIDEGDADSGFGLDAETIEGSECTGECSSSLTASTTSSSDTTSSPAPTSSSPPPGSVLRVTFVFSFQNSGVVITGGGMQVNNPSITLTITYTLNGAPQTRTVSASAGSLAPSGARGNSNPNSRIVTQQVDLPVGATNFSGSLSRPQGQVAGGAGYRNNTARVSQATDGDGNPVPGRYNVTVTYAP